MNNKLLVIARVIIFISIGLWFFTHNQNASLQEIDLESVNNKKPDIIITSVYDNYRVDSDLKTAWGFSCLIETPAERILFDTGGSSDILPFNLEKMNIDPRSIQKIVLSHIHGDHVGGLNGFLEQNNQVTVYIPHTFPSSIRETIINHHAKIHEISEPMKISDFVYSTGELPGPPNEQSLLIDSQKGAILITGCAHPGIVNIVLKAKDIIKKETIYLALGGFHQPPLSVVKELRKIGVKKVAPSHCTGDSVREIFAEEYQEDFIEFGVGQVIKIKKIAHRGSDFDS